MERLPAYIIEFVPNHGYIIMSRNMSTELFNFYFDSVDAALFHAGEFGYHADSFEIRLSS
jgi:hypothetical protein